MVSNNLVKFLVTATQLEKIKSDALNQGFKSISEYARHRMLCDNAYQIDINARLIRIETTLYEGVKDGLSKR